MFDTLWTFGDSWTYGAELPAQTRQIDNYTGQLAKMLRVGEINNFSEVGSSIEHLVMQFRQATSGFTSGDKKNIVAVFFLTGQERFLFFDRRNDFAHLTGSGSVVRPVQQDLREQFDQIYYFYYKNIHSHQADVLTLNTNILALQTMCQYHGVKDFYISGWQKLNLWHEIDTSRVYGAGLTTCADILKLDSNGKSQHIVSNGSHPNSTGHRLLAQTMFDWIKLNSVDM